MSDGIMNRYRPVYTVELNPKLTLKTDTKIIAKMHSDRSLMRLVLAAFYAKSLAEVLVKFILSSEITIKVSTNSKAIFIGVLIIYLHILKGSFMNQKIMFITLFTKFCSMFFALSYEKKSDSDGGVAEIDGGDELSVLLTLTSSFGSRIKFCRFSFEIR